MGAKLITPEIGTIIWTVITFVILAALLGRFAWKPLIQMLEERENTIKDALDKTERARAEAEETLRKNREILSNARRDTAAIIEQGRRESEMMRAELLTRATELEPDDESGRREGKVSLSPGHRDYQSLSTGGRRAAWILASSSQRRASLSRTLWSSRSASSRLMGVRSADAWRSSGCCCCCSVWVAEGVSCSCCSCWPACCCCSPCCCC